MKKIKLFTFILALGLGSTATFAFKTKQKATEVGILNGGYSYQFYSGIKYIVINSAINADDIDGLNYACVVYDNLACEVVYLGEVPSFYDGGGLYLNSNYLVSFTDQSELDSIDN